MHAIDAALSCPDRPHNVLLDVAGKAHAINYGFTNAHSLARQVEEILAQDETQEAEQFVKGAS